METDLKQEFRDLLEASGWSQAEAARQLGMTPSALSQIVRENSPVRPSPVTLRLFKLLLLRENPEAARMASHRRSPIQKWERDLIADLRMLSPRVRKAMLKTLRVKIEIANAGTRKSKTNRR